MNEEYQLINSPSILISILFLIYLNVYHNIVIFQNFELFLMGIENKKNQETCNKAVTRNKLMELVISPVTYIIMIIATTCCCICLYTLSIISVIVQVSNPNVGDMVRMMRC